MFIGLNIALAVILLDQLSKYYMLNEVLSDRMGLYVAPFFNLVANVSATLRFRSIKHRRAGERSVLNKLPSDKLAS